MQITDKQKRTILIVLGIIIVGVILLFVLKGCEAKEYAITFDTNGGSNVSSLTIKKEGKITKPEDPTKEGYIFAGWYYNGKEFDFNTEVTKDMKLEARWTKIEVTAISLNAQSLTLKPEGIAELEVIFTPEGSSSELVWESSDSTIVTVNEKGELKALKDGEATITVTTKDGKYSATCKITVKDNAIAVTSVSIKGSKEVTVGSTIKLTANIKPTDASNKEIIWKSSDSKIATVDSKGNVKGLKAGKVKITVTTVDGEKEATIEITVKEKSANTPSTETPSTQTPTTPSKPSTGGSSTPSTGGNNTPTPSTPSEVKVTGVTLNKHSLTLNVKASDSLNATITPGNATNKTLKWSSSDESVATVDGNGRVTAKGEGTAIITVTTVDGNHTDTCTVTVNSVYVITLQAIKTDTGDIFQYRFISVTKDGKAMSKSEYESIKIGSTSYGERGEIDTVLKEDAESGSATIYFNNGKSATVKIVKS